MVIQGNGIDQLVDRSRAVPDRPLRGCKQIVFDCLVVRHLGCASVWRTTARRNLYKARVFIVGN